MRRRDSLFTCKDFISGVGWIVNLVGIDLTGISSEMASLMMNNKYEIDIPSETIHSTINRLTNQLWKLIPMKENNEDWQKQLQTLIIEISGLNVIFDSLFL